MLTNERRKGFKDYSQEIEEQLRSSTIISEEEENTNKAFTSLNVYES